ncbi:response regulator [Candidatus Bathyarchaeota archaeon]|nr:MAG: response regulator [Candidatus Bathyarchaeota archaeon]
MSKDRLLIVDDDEAILRNLEKILRLEGYETDIARTGFEAIEKTKTNFYNLALLDIKLPDMEGTELLKRMHETFPKMVKIMVTGYPDLENAIASLNSGADAYLIKPVSVQRLLDVVKQKLAEQKSVEEMTEEKVKEWIETRVRKLKHGGL